MGKKKDKQPLDELPTKRGILDPDAVCEKLRELAGNQAAVARHFGVTRQAVNLLVSKTPALREACHDAREAMKDNAESSLHRALLAGEAWAVCFYLKTQAKDRGYIEKTQHEHSGRTESIVEVVVSSRAEAAKLLIEESPL